jgi:hypothetical protein
MPGAICLTACSVFSFSKYRNFSQSTGVKFLKNTAVDETSCEAVTQGNRGRCYQS